MNNKPEQVDYRALLKRSLVAIDDLQARLDAVEQEKREPIAVIGIGCRFPGGANDPQAFWQLLHDGIDAVTEVPPERWDVDAFYDPDPDAPGKSYTRWGAFLDGVDQFDPQFFGIAPREAASMDPQQRLLLEVTWEALEHAGQAPANLSGSQTGVFVGIAASDYSHLQSRNGEPAGIDAYFGTGFAHSIAAGRLSYVLGLQGPAIAVDTACSSSLVAAHLACQSLRQGECDMALVAGANLILSPDGNIITSQARMMAFDGRCKTFDEAADGYVRGEGCGVVVLKRLADAQAGGDMILAVIQGTALNQDGRSNGLTAPNGLAQEAVIRAALENAGLEAGDVSYVEAHGTGTSLGDPIEIRALGATYGQARTHDDPLMVGSVKTNVGHLEAGAGIVGLIKTVLALQHKTIPPHLHFHQPNSYIPWDKIPVVVPTKPTLWAVSDGARRIAGLSSFGFSGTNSHMIIAAAPERETETAATERPYHLLTLSAKNEAALSELARRYDHILTEERFGKSFHDVCFTANSGRSHFSERLALVAGTTSQAQEKLAAWQSGDEPANLHRGAAPAGDRPEVAFLFTGQGSQYTGMGRQLYETQPFFRKVLDKCDELLRPHLEYPLLDVIFTEEQGSKGAREQGSRGAREQGSRGAGEQRRTVTPAPLHPRTPSPRSAELTSKPHPVRLSSRRSLIPSLINETAYTQPALFAIEYALAQLWRSWGIEPAVVMGHSVGEYVAACIAGVFSLEDGLKLIAARGRLMQALPAGGGMAAVFTGEATVTEAIVPYADEVSIAAVNGPTNIVISGEGTAVSAILATLKEQGVKSRRLTVSHAFHSPLMAPMLDEFERVAAAIAYSEPQIGLISNVTGELAGQETGTPAYWRDHVRAPVRFADAVQTLHDQGYHIFLESGPQPTLLGMARRIPKGAGEQRGRGAGEQRRRGAEETSPPHPSPLWLPSLRKGRDDWQQMLDSLAALYTHGLDVNWAALDKDYARNRVPLPTYPFQRQRYWMNLPKDPGQARRRRTAVHPLLEERLRSPILPGTAFASQLGANNPAFLNDHRIYGAPLFPATGYLEMGMAAAVHVFGPETRVIENVLIQEALILPESGEQTVQVTVSTAEDGRASFQVFSLEGEDAGNETWKLHASGEIRSGVDAAAPDPIALEEARARCPEEISAADYYRRLADEGVAYGPGFQGIEQIRRQDGEALARLQLPQTLAAEAGRYQLHPALLDAAIQSLGAAIPGANDGTAANNVYVPVSLGSYRLYHPGRTAVYSQAAIRPEAGSLDESLTGDLRLFDESGLVVAELNGVHLRRVSRDAIRRATQRSFDEWLYAVEWERLAIGDWGLGIGEFPGSWLIFADSGGVGDALATRLQEQGQNCVLVRPGDVLPAETADFERLLAKAAGDEDRPYRGAIHLWSLDAVAAPTISSLHADQAAITGSALSLIQALLNNPATAAAALWLVTRGAQMATAGQTAVAVAQTPLWGLANTLSLEHPDRRCVCLDLDPAGAADPVTAIWAELGADDGEDRVAWRGDGRYVARLVRSSDTPTGLQLPPNQPFELALAEQGILDNISVRPVARRQPGPGEVEVRVQATGLNFRDVLNALGMYPGPAGPLGNECTGTITAVGAGVTNVSVGDEVLALGAGTFRSHLITAAASVFPKPAAMSFAEVATIPITFLTAYYGLHHLAQIKPGDRILIHAAAGGVGMAAVQLAQQAGAEIFGTAGNPEKRAFLQSLGVQHVMDSRSLDFAGEIMAITGGEGVHIVLNSLADEFIPKSLSVLADNGRFLEIGKRGIWTPEQVAQLNPTLEYYVYDLAMVLQEDLNFMAATLSQLMPDFESGALKPLPLRTFPMQQAIAAFRYMAQAKHIGKIVVTQREQGSRGAGEQRSRGAEVPSPPHPLTPAPQHPLTPAPLLREDATYLITGGLGGLGLVVAEGLVERGARHLVLMGRSAPADAAGAVLARLEQAEAQVMVVQGDVSRREDVARVLAQIEAEMPPLRGVIHAAGVLDDGVLRQQSWPRFERVMAPKMDGAWHLHQLTQPMPLDFFVLFSAGAALLGSPGQGNYAAANAFLDGLAHYRRAQGLPALSINWGAWAQVGMAAVQSSQEQRRWAAAGMGLIRPAEGMAVLAQLLPRKMAQVGVLPINWERLAGQSDAGQERPLLRRLLRAARAKIEAKATPSEPRFLSRLETAAPDEQRELLQAHVQTQVIKVLGLDPSQPIDERQGLTDIGMDSLMAVELSNRLQRSLGETMPSTLAFEYPTIAALTDYLATEALSLGAEPAADETEEDEIQATIMAELEELSDDEAADSLLKELESAGY